MKIGLLAGWSRALPIKSDLPSSSMEDHSVLVIGLAGAAAAAACASPTYHLDKSMEDYNKFKVLGMGEVIFNQSPV